MEIESLCHSYVLKVDRFVWVASRLNCIELDSDSVCHPHLMIYPSLHRYSPGPSLGFLTAENLFWPSVVSLIFILQAGDASHFTESDENIIKLLQEELGQESFTHVVITGIKPEHVQYLREDFNRWCTQLVWVQESDLSYCSLHHLIPKIKRKQMCFTQLSFL